MEFSLQDNKITKLSDEQWVQEYIYSEFHEILFFSFVQEIHEWLSCLSKFDTCTKDYPVTMRNPKLIQQVEKLDNKIMCVVDHSIDRLLGGFVTKFSIDQFLSYSKEE